MKVVFNRDASIEVKPESEVEVYAIHNFIQDFRAGFGKIIIHRDNVSNAKSSISVNPHNDQMMYEEIRKSE